MSARACTARRWKSIWASLWSSRTRLVKGGTLGSMYVVRAKADGYTLLWGGTSTLAVAPNLYKGVNYDASNFKPIGMAMKTPQMIAANPATVKTNCSAKPNPRC